MLNSPQDPRLHQSRPIDNDWTVRRGWLVLLFLAVTFSGCAKEEVPQESESQPFNLVVEYADAREARRMPLPWKQGMTVMDALRQAAEEGVIEFKSRGEGPTAFVRSIDRIENEGGGENARNWIFLINGKKSPESAGVSKISAGDVVLWKFSTSVE